MPLKCGRCIKSDAEDDSFVMRMWSKKKYVFMHYTSNYLNPFFFFKALNPPFTAHTGALSDVVH